MINIKDICDKVFYINLKDSTIRNEQSIENLSKLNLSIERVEAVSPNTYKQHALEYGIDLDFDEIPKINSKQPYIWNVHTKRTPRWRGDICCSLSHYKALITAKKQGLKKVMICEDDFVFLSSESLEFQKNIEQIPKDFDVIHITSLIHSNYNNAFKGNKFIDYKLTGGFINDFVFQVKGGLLGTGAYIVNLENDEWVKDFSDAMRLGSISDCVMAFKMQGKYKHYTTKYKLGYQDYLEPTTIARSKGIEYSLKNSRIKWLKGVTENTPWTILEQKNKEMVKRIRNGFDW